MKKSAKRAESREEFVKRHGLAHIIKGEHRKNKGKQVVADVIHVFTPNIEQSYRSGEENKSKLKKREEKQ